MKRRRSRLFKVLRISGGLAFLMATGLILLPYLLTTDFVRHRVLAELSEQLGTEVQVASYSISWFGGLSLEGLVLANPPGYRRISGQSEALRVDRIDCDLSFAQLVRGRIDLQASLSGMDLQIVQSADGDSNLEDVIGEVRGPKIRLKPGRRSSRGGRRWNEDVLPFKDLEDFRLDLEVRDSSISFSHEDLGLLEKVQSINVRLSKSFGLSSLRLEGAADFHRPSRPDRPGRIDLRIDAGPSAEDPIDLELHCLGIELDRYRPIITSLLPPGDLSDLSGQLRGDLKLTCEPEHRFEIEGLLEIEGPRFGGPFFGGANIAEERWSLRPNLLLDLGEGWTLEGVDVSKLEADLGFLQVKGIEAAESLGTVAFELDLENLPDLGIRSLKGLRESRGEFTGILGLEESILRDEADSGEALILDSRVTIERMLFEGHSLEDCRGTARIENGELILDFDEGRLNGGSLDFEIVAGIADEDALPLSMAVNIDAARATAKDIKPLSYLVPFMAGARSGGALRFSSEVDLEFAVSGQIDRDKSTDLASRLRGLSGSGSLMMRGGQFVPTDELSRLFALAGRRQSVDLKDLSSEFTLDRGSIQTSVMELSSAGREFTLEGNTGLDGSIDYRIDVTDLLKGHRDGEKVRDYLGENILEARMSGTLEAPELAMPDLNELLAKAAENALKHEAQKRVDKLLEKLFKKK
jgi:hypothetical protein